MVNELIISGDDVRDYREKYSLTQEQLAELLETSPRTVQNYEKEGVPKSNLKKVSRIFSSAPNLSLNKNSDSHEIVREAEAVYVRNYTEMQNRGVPLVSYYAYGGYLNGFGDPEYLESLPKIPVADEVERKGEYLFFEVKGDSMDDNTKRAIAERDLILVRNISKDYWKSKLHLHKWERFVIVHNTEGILVKEIIKHDVENGIITAHSYNDFYPDMELHLKDVQQLFNVIEVRRR